MASGTSSVSQESNLSSLSFKVVRPPKKRNAETSGAPPAKRPPTEDAVSKLYRNIQLDTYEPPSAAPSAIESEVISMLASSSTQEPKDIPIDSFNKTLNRLIRAQTKNTINILLILQKLDSLTAAINALSSRIPVPAPAASAFTPFRAPVTQGFPSAIPQNLVPRQLTPADGNSPCVLCFTQPHTAWTISNANGTAQL